MGLLACMLHEGLQPDVRVYNALLFKTDGVLLLFPSPRRFQLCACVRWCVCLTRPPPGRTQIGDADAIAAWLSLVGWGRMEGEHIYGRWLDGWIER
jgi:hypothetical protein